MALLGRRLSSRHCSDGSSRLFGPASLPVRCRALYLELYIYMVGGGHACLHEQVHLDIFKETEQVLCWLMASCMLENHNRRDTIYISIDMGHVCR